MMWSVVKKRQGTSPNVAKASASRATAYRAKAFKTHTLVEVPSDHPSAKKYKRQNEVWCTECLTKLGGYGGGSKVRHLKLTCKQSKRLPQKQQRIKAAWKRVGKKTCTDGTPIVRKVSEWVRNLLDDGDIESNPGPSSQSVLKTACVNCGSAKGLWSTIRLVLTQQEIDVFLIQEVSLRPSEIAAVKRYVFQLGYAFFCLCGYETKGVGYRGVGVFVKLKHSTRCLKEWHHRDGQAIAVIVQGFIFVSMYVAQIGCSELHQDILEWLTVSIPHAPWLLLGDHNCLPEENELCRFLIEDGASLMAVHDEQGVLVPTRFKGRRCIDYGITCVPSAIHLLGHSDLVIADHKMLSFEVHMSQGPIPKQTACLRMPFTWECPEHCTRDVWHATVAEMWDEESSLPALEQTQVSVDQAWDLWCSKLERVLKAANDRVLPDVADANVNRRKFEKNSLLLAKNKVHLFQTTAPHGTRKMPNSTFRERKLAHLVGRLCDMLHLENVGLSHSSKYKGLAEKVQNFGNLPSGDTSSKLTWARAQLKQHRCDVDTAHLRAWKERLRLSPKACYSWLTNSQVVTQLNIFSSKVPDLGISDNLTSALIILQRHWRCVWDRACDWHSAFEALRPYIHVKPVISVSCLTAEHIQRSAVKMRGRSAGADGWGGSEIADLPACVFSEVAILFNHFEQTGMTPTCWQVARQVFVPKPLAVDVSLDNGFPADKLRPITVLSVWYRLWSRARLTSPELEAWLSDWWPSDATGGKKGSEIYDSLIDIDDKVHLDQNFLISLDFSLAFDHLHPRLAIEMFMTLGLSPGLASMLSSIWCHQQRILVYGGQAHPEPQRVVLHGPCLL